MLVSDAGCCGSWPRVGRGLRTFPPPTPQLVMDAFLQDGVLVDSHPEDLTMPLTASSAPSPFNKLNADVVLHSLDGTQLSLPTSSPAHLVFDASSATLETLLRICYPIPKPKSDHSVADIETALRAAVKYQLELPIAVLEDELVDFAHRGSALEVWALACRMKREALARRAVECTFGDDKFDAGRIGNMQGVSAGDYFRFREYRRLRGQVASQFELCRSPLALPNSEVHHEPGPSPPESLRSDADDLEAYEEVARFVPTIPDPDLICIASDAGHLSVHRIFLAEASPIISRQLAQHGIPVSLVSRNSGKKKVMKVSAFKPPTISVDEDSTILATLFQLCYPGDHTLPTTPSACLAALAAAGRLGMPRIVAELSAHWRTLAKQDPLRAYFAAARIGQNACAEEAAKYIVQTRLDGHYIWEMETTPAISYHLLTTYYDRCRAAAKALLRGACISPTAPSSSLREPSAVSDVPSEAVASTEVKRSADSEVWLQEYLDGLCTTVDEHPGQIPPGAPEALFKQASVSGQMCRSCEGFVLRLSSVAQALRSVPSAVDKVEFKWT
ncbi:hypothetical protein C8T65DRAFT_639624 [Cerioporus squamosus]|nr:hypothetical protein C8T65DRAFT_639624 [Cerioporus squamosus]